MAVSAQAGIVGFGPQSGKGSLPDTWYRHRATLVDLGVNDDVREGVPEVGGIAVPTFPYKAGPIVAGGFTIQPRFENTLGWLLLGMLGSVQSAETGVGTGIYDHVFTIDPDDSTYVPWMGMRKATPRKDADPATDLGEVYKDCKIIGGGLALPNDSPLTMRIDALGREFEEDLSPNDWVWDNDFEHWESIPVACQTDGYINIDAETLPVVAAQVGWQNVPLDLRQERVYGDPFLEDITIVQRRLVYDLTVKWNNPDLYLKVLTGSPTGLAWSGDPFTAAFQVKSVSSRNMPGESERYSMIIDADEVMMTQVGGIQLAGNQAIMMRFQGVALEATNYASFTLRNKQASYDWPVGGS